MVGKLMFGIFKKKKWFVVGRSENLDLWTVTHDRPQVKCRLLLLASECGSRDYVLDMLDASPSKFNSSIRYCMIDQVIPREYVHKFLSGWTADKINRVHGQKVFNVEKTPYESFKSWR
ncbi:hypothetical protein VPHD480_0291 [Vibrio phage D480]